MKRGLLSCLLIIVAGSSVFAQQAELRVPYVSSWLPFTRYMLPIDPDAAVWKRAEPVTVQLLPQQMTIPFGGGTTPSIQVRALHNGREIAFLLEWNDPNPDIELAPLDKFSDAVAISFPIDLDPLPNPLMGDAENGVNLWHWQAAWQRDVTEGGIKDVDRKYPAYSYEVPYGVYVSKDLGNWRAKRNRKTPVENLVAKGFGTLTSLPKQEVLGHGVWKDGKWKVVIRRQYQPIQEGDTRFVPGTSHFFNVAVWQGSKGERGGRKSVSMVWHPFKLEPIPSPTVWTLVGMVLVAAFVTLLVVRYIVWSADRTDRSISRQEVT